MLTPSYFITNKAAVNSLRHAPYWKILRGIYLASRLTELPGHRAYVGSSDIVNSIVSQGSLRLLPRIFTSLHFPTSMIIYILKAHQ